VREFYGALPRRCCGGLGSLLTENGASGKAPALIRQALGPLKVNHPQVYFGVLRSPWKFFTCNFTCKRFPLRPRLHVLRQLPTPSKLLKCVIPPLLTR